MNRHGAIGVKQVDSGHVTICAEADGTGANYDALCGNSLSDDEFVEVPIAVNARIDCVQCKGMWRAALRFNSKDFTP